MELQIPVHVGFDGGRYEVGLVKMPFWVGSRFWSESFFSEESSFAGHFGVIRVAGVEVDRGQVGFEDASDEDCLIGF